MRAVHFLGGGQISIDPKPCPKPQGRDVLVKMKSASICGTDRENLWGSGQPKVPGHENAGVVAGTDRPAWVREGDRVAINCHITCGSCEYCLKGDLYFCKQLQVVGFDRDGGFADYLLVPEACCMPLPHDITFEHGSLIVDMLGTPFRAVKRAHLLPGERVAVWGAGPIGLGLLMTAKRFGAEVAVIEPSEYRLLMAKAYNPDLVINPESCSVERELRSWTNGRGIDAAFDCVGSEKVSLQAIANLKKRGRLVVVGVSQSLTLNPWEHLICNELTVIGTRNFNLRDFDEMVNLIRTDLALLDVVTHRFSLAHAKLALDVFSEGQCGKILFVEEDSF
jgi:threonine dehydrogenase-like Zn-dependent dehydrogenase